MPKDFEPDERLTNREYIYKETLPNGLRILVHEMPWAQSVSTSLLVSAGPRWERKNTSGTAHYLEHMLFEGSSKYPSTREIDKAIEGIGGESGASTDLENTTYNAKVPSSHSLFALEFLRNIVFEPLMTEEAVKKEKGIILSELKRSIDDPDDNMWWVMKEFMWKNHPLGQKTLGTQQSIEAINKNDLETCHREFYTPDNIVLVIAGNIESSQAIKQAGEIFGGLCSRVVKEDVSAPQYVKPGSNVLIIKRDIEEIKIKLAFSTEGLGKKSLDKPTIQILSKLLGKSVFYKLVYDLGLSYSVGSYPWLASDNGILSISASVPQDKSHEALDVIIDEVKNLEITDASVREAKESLKGGLTLHLADTNDYTSLIGSQEISGGNIDTPEQIRSKIENVAIEQIIELKKKIIRDETSALILSGKIDESEANYFKKQLSFT